jgi:hypothetical protein
MEAAAAGFCAHTGWVAAVMIAGPAGAPRVVERRRVNLLAPGVPFECYHAAAAMPRAKAEVMLERARTTATDLAREVLTQMNEGRNLVAVGVVLSNVRPLLTIDDALSSHPMQHAAEGQLYRQALMDAARQLKLRVRAVPQRDLEDVAAVALGMSVHQLRARIGDLGRDIGPPWALDQKRVSLVAWLALAAKEA